MVYKGLGDDDDDVHEDDNDNGGYGEHPFYGEGKSEEVLGINTIRPL